MGTETIIAIIAAVGGLSGLVSATTTALFKYLEYKKAQSGDTIGAKLKPLEERLEVQQQQLLEIRLDTTRTQLIMLMQHQPHNHDTILMVAERYFCELHGDWYCTSLFREWTKREGIDIPPEIEAVTKGH